MIFHSSVTWVGANSTSNQYVVTTTTQSTGNSVVGLEFVFMRYLCVLSHWTIRVFPMEEIFLSAASFCWDLYPDLNLLSHYRRRGYRQSYHRTRFKPCHQQTMDRCCFECRLLNHSTNFKNHWFSYADSSQLDFNRSKSTVLWGKLCIICRYRSKLLSFSIGPTNLTIGKLILSFELHSDSCLTRSI